MLNNISPKILKNSRKLNSFCLYNDVNCLYSCLEVNDTCYSLLHSQHALKAPFTCVVCTKTVLSSFCGNLPWKPNKTCRDSPAMDWHRVQGGVTVVVNVLVMPYMPLKLR